VADRRESMRTSRKEQVRPRILDRAQEPTKVRPLLRRDVAFDDAGDIVVDREIARFPTVETVRIGFRRQGRHEGIGQVPKRQPLLG